MATSETFGVLLMVPLFGAYKSLLACCCSRSVADSRQQSRALSVAAPLVLSKQCE